MKPVRYSNYLAADLPRRCEDKPRLLAWLTGNLR